MCCKFSRSDNALTSVSPTCAASLADLTVLLQVSSTISWIKATQPWPTASMTALGLTLAPLSNRIHQWQPWAWHWYCPQTEYTDDSPGLDTGTALKQNTPMTALGLTLAPPSNRMHQWQPWAWHWHLPQTEYTNDSPGLDTSDSSRLDTATTLRQNTPLTALGVTLAPPSNRIHQWQPWAWHWHCPQTEYTNDSPSLDTGTALKQNTLMTALGLTLALPSNRIHQWQPRAWHVTGTTLKQNTPMTALG